MELTSVRQLFREKEQFAGQKVTVGGWVRSNRDSKNFGFLVVNDGTFFETLQVVYAVDTHGEFFTISPKLNVGAAVIVKGTTGGYPTVQNSPLRCRQTEVAVEGACGPDYPLQKKRHTFEYLRTIDPSASQNQYVPGCFPGSFADLLMRFINFSRSRAFVYVHTPLITGSDCEGAGEMFQVTTMDLNNIPKNRGRYCRL